MFYERTNLRFPPHGSGICTGKFQWLYLNLSQLLYQNNVCYKHTYHNFSNFYPAFNRFRKVKLKQNFSRSFPVFWLGEPRNEIRLARFTIVSAGSRHQDLIPFDPSGTELRHPTEHPSSGPESITLYCLQRDLASRIFMINLGLRVVFIIFLMMVWPSHLPLHLLNRCILWWATSVSVP